MFESLKLSQFFRKTLITLYFFLFGLFALFSFGLFICKGLWFAFNRCDFTDIAPYHIATQIVKDGKASKLYDFTVQTQYLDSLFKPYLKALENQDTKPIYIAEREWLMIKAKVVHQNYYYYPPISLVFLYLLSSLSPSGLWIFINSFSLISFGLVCWLACKDLRLQYKSFYVLAFLIACIAFFPFKQNFFYSQISLILSVCFYLYFYFQKRGKYLAAGIFLSLCLLKPHFGLPFLLLPILFKQFKTLSCCMLSLFCLSMIGLFFIGPIGYEQYFKAIIQLTGLQDFGLFVPSPVGGSEIDFESIYGQLQKWLGSKEKANFFANVFNLFFLGLTVFIALFKTGKEKFQFLQKPKENFNKIDIFKFCLIALIFLMISSYRMIHDYCLLIVIVLLLWQIGEKWVHKSLFFFCGYSMFFLILNSSFIPNRLLVEKFQIHTIVLFTLSMIGLMLWELIINTKEFTENTDSTKTA